MGAFHAVLGEDESDAEALAVMIRRIRETANYPPIKIKKFGFEGCSGLLRKGHRSLAAYFDAGCTRAYVCYDADNSPLETVSVRQERVRKIIAESGVAKERVCGIVAVQELEAWLLADIEQVRQIFSDCDHRSITSPERINNPKEHLREITRHALSRKYRYSPPSHNVVMAGYVRLELLHEKCPSFRDFYSFAAAG